MDKQQPIAWLMVERENGNAYFKMAEPTRDEKVSHHPYPLYTHPHPDNLGLALSIIDQQKLEIEKLKAHPVKELTLTDEEIECIRSQCGIELIDGTWRIDENKFARAILRKAQEK